MPLSPTLLTEDAPGPNYHGGGLWVYAFPVRREKNTSCGERKGHVFLFGCNQVYFCTIFILHEYAFDLKFKL